jgi:hypothetical protein
LAIISEVPSTPGQLPTIASALLADGEPPGLAAGEPVGLVTGETDADAAGVVGVETAGFLGGSDVQAPRKLIPANTQDANIIVFFICFVPQTFMTA